MDLNEEHFFLTSAQDIDQICAPLKKHFGITSFVYQKNFFKGGEIRLSNQPYWLKHFYNQEYYKDSLFEKAKPDEYQSGFVLWSELQNHSTVLNAAKEFHIAHGITLTLKTSDGIELYFLGTTPGNNKITSLYLNNMDLLERFISYFKDKAKNIIREACKHKIYIHKHYDSNQLNKENIAIFSPNEKINRESFLEETLLKSFIIDEKTILTKRELDCAFCLLRGDTSQEMSEFLFISPRTAESHIDALRQKLNCKSKSALIKKLQEYGFNTSGVNLFKS